MSVTNTSKFIRTLEDVDCGNKILFKQIMDQNLLITQIETNLPGHCLN